MQDEDSGYLVDNAFSAHGSVAGVIKMAVGLGGGEPFVPEMDREGELRTDLFGESLRFGGLWALVPRHVEWVANDGLGNGVLSEDAGNGLHVCAAIGPMQSEEWLRGEAEGIRDRDANAAVANVEADDTGGESDGRCLLIHKVSVRKLDDLNLWLWRVLQYSKTGLD